MSTVISPQVQPSWGTSILPDDLPRTVVGLLRQRVGELGSDRFLKCGGDWITWSAFDRSTDVVAAGLQYHGVENGERLAILARTSLAMIETYFAGAKAGATLIPLNIFLKGEFLRHQLAHSKSSTVAVDAEGLGSLVRILPELPDVRRVLLLQDAGETSELDDVTVISFESLRSETREFVPVDISPTDLFQVMYSSGTTGPSKGCMLSNLHALRIGGIVAYHYSATRDDLHYCGWPMNHVSGTSALLVALVVGIPVVMTPTMVAEGLIERLAEEGATMFTALGPLPPALLSQPPKETDKKHNIRMSQMAPCPPDLQVAIEERFGFAVTAEVYGQSECTLITLSRVDDEQRKRGTNGRVVPDVEVILLDDDDEPVPVGETGEICIRPRSLGAMFDGYLDDPEATLAAMRGMWFHTGDLGCFDEDGFMTFVDRKKDMMRRSGENISSFELETSLRAHPAVINAAVHETAGVLDNANDIVAWLVVAPSATLDPAEFAEFLWDSVPYYAVPRYIRIVDELPLTPSGRVQKFKLREKPLESTPGWDLKAMDLLTPKERRR